jgi:hypothetical protein
MNMAQKDFSLIKNQLVGIRLRKKVDLLKIL